MKILLINPWIYDVASYDYWLKPLGLLMLARKLHESNHELRLIDCLDRYDPDFVALMEKPVKSKWNGTGKFFSEVVKKPAQLAHVPRFFKRYGIPKQLFEQKLNRIKNSGFYPDYVFVTSAMTYWYPGPFEAIKTVKEMMPNTTVVLGGNYANLMQDHSNLSGADLVCKKSKMSEVLDFLSLNGIEIGETVKKRHDFIPLYDLYDHPMSHLVFLTSLGCPYRCTYCATPFLQDFIQEDPLKIVEAIDRYSVMFDVKNIAFFDDAILINHKNHFDKILQLLINKDIINRGIIIHIPNGIHAKLLTQDTAELMMKANVKTIKVALETINPQLQSSTGGKVTNKEFFRAVNILKQTGFTKNEIAAFILINLPGQSLQEAIEVHDICKGLDIMPEINEYTPIPGTVDFRKVFGNDRLPNGFDPLMLNNTILSFSWKNGLTVDEIELIKNYNKKVVRELKNGGS
ncbi:MAG TPA: radical SAM protein [Thermotogota bacterium]|nr:radical SAM protein [Thermotogota bacterium]